jgi:lipid-A-disaccharide synthase
MSAQPTFALVAGETSGDLLGAALIADLRQRYPAARFVGIGGSAMRAAGMECWWDSAELAVFGLFEVLAHLPRLLRIRRELQRKVLQQRPAAFIGIDAPDFNLGLERKLKLAGIRTVHYVSPTVWAWRPGRVARIARSADLLLCLFPFEPACYDGHGVAVVYVGHPMASRVAPHTDNAAARRQLALDARAQVIALLPGSRAGEVSRLSAPMIEAAAILSANHPDLVFVAALANPRMDAIFRTALARRPAADIRLVAGQAQTVMAASDLVICASGTATLEAMLVNRPLVVVYRLAAATYWLARLLRLVKSRFIALPNILAGEALVPELVQRQATGPAIAREANRWLGDQQARARLDARFAALHRELLPGSAQQAAGAIATLLERPV